MRNLFSVILNMSMTGSIVILLVMLARLILKRSPKIFSYALWAVVLFRLLCPVAFTAPVSALNALAPEVQEASELTSIVYYLPAQLQKERNFTFVPAENQSGNQIEQPEPVSHTELDIMQVASYVWIAGTAVMLLYSVIQYIRLRLKLVGAMAYSGNVYCADYIDTPFVMGIFSPKIYLPSDVPTKERKYIIAHERHHIHRFDHIIKLLAHFALCIHWFNPLVWAAFILAGKDMEMSCDEAVIKRMGSQIRADYSASLLRLATHKKIIAGIPLAFGEGDTKGRVMNMAKWKKPKLWVSIVCLMLCASILVACAVNPAADNTDHTESTTQQPEQLPLVASDELEPVVDGSHIITDTELVQYGTLKMLLPAGLAAREQDGAVVLTKDSVDVGGITCYSTPEFELKIDENMSDWVSALGLPEGKMNLDGPISQMIGSTLHGDLETEFFYDMDPSVLNTEHHFYIDGKLVYDVWYDQNLISDDIAERFLKTIAINTDPVVAGNPVITDTELVQYGTLKMLLPSGFAAINEDDTVVMTKDSVAVGGIRHWNYPEFQPSDIVELKKEETGAPIGYMSGSSAYGDMEYEIFWDGNPEGLNEQHEFFIDGDIVYDVWYDQNLISDGIAERFLKTVAINTDPVIEANPAEQAAFAKCRAVLDAIQNGSCHIVIEQSATGDSESHWSTANYYQGNGNWLEIVDVDPESANIVDGEQYSLRIAFMVASGVRYSNEEKWGKAYTDIDWREDNLTFNDSVKPWLASFQCDDAVAYMHTLTDENGECVMLRVDKKYIDSDGYDPHYFVYFNFDPDGNFVNAQLQVNLFRENELVITESIVSLNPETVNAEIQKEYRRAIG